MKHRSYGLALFVALALVASPALADDDREAFEREMFGSPDDAPPEPAADPAEAPDEPEVRPPLDEREARELDMFGSPDDLDEPAGLTEPPLPAEAPPRVVEPRTAPSLDLFSTREDPLAIGGRLYLRLQQQFIRDTEIPEGQPTLNPLSSPNLLDLYLDARPNDRVRGYVTGRLIYDFTAANSVNPVTGEERSTTAFDIDQLWMRFDVGRKVFVTAGRQHLRWGVGRFWNPTDFLYLQNRDPLAIIDERLGSTLIRVHFPVESLAWNFYAVANLEGASSIEEVGGALRAEFLFGVTELALSAAAQKDRPLQLGASLSSGLGPFDVRAEAALLNGVETPFFEGNLVLDPSAPVFPTSYSRKDEWIAQVSLGAEVGVAYGDNDAFYLGAEYFFNDAGYDSNELYPWLLFNGTLRPFYVGRHYAALYALLPSPGSWNDTTFTLSALSNLSDRSVITRLDYRVRVLTYLSAYAWGMAHLGDPGEFRFGFEVPPVAFIPELENGLVVPEPFFNIGVGLMMNF